MKDLVVIERPELPTDWDYQQSVETVKQVVYKWQNITLELAKELWIAKKILSSPGKRTDLVVNATGFTWGQYCKDIGVDRSTIHRWLATWFKGDRVIKDRKETPTLPIGKYSVIYADPPWKYEFSETTSRKIENQYPTMPLEAIINLPVPNIAANDCVLFLWVTSPKLTEGLAVLEAWGFEYKTCAVWDKQKIGMGYYFRQQHELLLVGKKGNPPVPEPSNRVSSIITRPREKHSKKPDRVYEIIEGMYPAAKKIELFSRSPREGWDSYGNQIQ